MTPNPFRPGWTLIAAVHPCPPVPIPVSVAPGQAQPAALQYPSSYLFRFQIAAREQGYAYFKTKGDNPQEMVGKYVVIWEKVGGKWKLDSDIGLRVSSISLPKGT
jgi:hypothetical protein